jgi:hypothetical protein
LQDILAAERRDRVPVGLEAEGAAGADDRDRNARERGSLQCGPDQDRTARDSHISRAVRANQPGDLHHRRGRSGAHTHATPEGVAARKEARGEVGREHGHARPRGRIAPCEVPTGDEVDAERIECPGREVVHQRLASRDVGRALHSDLIRRHAQRGRRAGEPACEPDTLDARQRLERPHQLRVIGRLIKALIAAGSLAEADELDSRPIEARVGAPEGRETPCENNGREQQRQ